MTKLSTNNIFCDFCEQAHESGACLLSSLGLSKEQVKYISGFTRQQRYPYFDNLIYGWPNRQKISWVGERKCARLLWMESLVKSKLTVRQNKKWVNRLVWFCKLRNWKRKRERWRKCKYSWNFWKIWMLLLENIDGQFYA